MRVPVSRFHFGDAARFRMRGVAASQTQGAATMTMLRAGRAASACRRTAVGGGAAAAATAISRAVGESHSPKHACSRLHLMTEGRVGRIVDDRVKCNADGTLNCQPRPLDVRPVYCVPYEKCKCSSSVHHACMCAVYGSPNVLEIPEKARNV